MLALYIIWPCYDGDSDDNDDDDEIIAPIMKIFFKRSSILSVCLHR